LELARQQFDAELLADRFERVGFRRPLLGAVGHMGRGHEGILLVTALDCRSFGQVASPQMNPIIESHLKMARASCGLAHEFLTVRQRTVGIATTPSPRATESEQIRLASLSGYFSRTLAWLRSIKKLDEASDVQAVTVASRSLFEAAIDLVLVRHEPKEHSFDMMFAWERSAKLAQAEKVRDFFTGKAVPDESRTWVEFLADPDVPRIRADRVRWWKKDEHPQRWTGLKRNLRRDAERANGLRPAFELHLFYELEFSPTCWGTHGSTLAAFRSSSDDLVPGLTATALTYVLRFSMQVTQLVMEELSMWRQEDYADLLAKIQGLVVAEAAPTK
jgi:hypothetical protein